MPILPEFIVLTLTCKRFLEETDLGVEIEAAIRKVNLRILKRLEERQKK